MGTIICVFFSLQKERITRRLCELSVVCLRVRKENILSPEMPATNFRAKVRAFVFAPFVIVVVIL
jgi:hypothetical protein